MSQEIIDNAEMNDINEAAETTKTTGKGNEDKKIFVGGIPFDVTNEGLAEHFSQFGEVAQAQIKIDRVTGRSRGFAFVEFATNEACKAALNAREQILGTKTVEVKPAKSRENKKVFVGGLPAETAEEELRKYFETFGKVEDIEWPFDRENKIRRNFAFIVFEEEDSADRASRNPKHTFGNRECDVKKAVPQGKRFAVGRGGNSMRGAYGLGRGIGVINGWYPHAAWSQINAFGAYGTTAGGWGDWYNNPATTGFYQQGAATGFTPYGAGGYETFPQAQTLTGQRIGNQQRVQQQQQQQPHQQPQY